MSIYVKYLKIAGFDILLFSGISSLQTVMIRIWFRIWGLRAVQFPWDVKHIRRFGHEKKSLRAVQFPWDVKLEARKKYQNICLRAVQFPWDVKRFPRPTFRKQSLRAVQFPWDVKQRVHARERFIV